MKIITDNYNSVAPKVESRAVSCEHCNSYISVEDSDLTVGEYGLMKFTCPCCGKESYTDIDIKLTKDNIEFPLHFSDPADAKKVSDSDTTEYVRRAIAYLQENPTERYWYMATGDTFVLALKEEDFIEIEVAKQVYHSGVYVK